MRSKPGKKSLRTKPGEKWKGENNMDEELEGINLEAVNLGDSEEITLPAVEEQEDNQTEEVDSTSNIAVDEEKESLKKV